MPLARLILCLALLAAQFSLNSAATFSPASGAISNTFLSAAATFSSTGVYVLRVTVSDSLLTDSDTLTVTVLPGTNSPPLVNAGPDQLVAMSAPAFSTQNRSFRSKRLS